MYTYLYIYITYWQPFYASELYGPHCEMKQIKKKEASNKDSFASNCATNLNTKCSGKKASSEASLNSCTKDEA